VNHRVFIDDLNGGPGWTWTTDLALIRGFYGAICIVSWSFGNSASLHQRLGEWDVRPTATWDRRHQVGASRMWEEEVAALPYKHRVSIQTRKTVERLPAKQVFRLVIVWLRRSSLLSTPADHTQI